MSRWHILSDDYPPLDGGVASWTQNVARGLTDAQCDVTVWTRSRPGSDAVRENFPVKQVTGRSFGRWGGWYLALRAAFFIRRGDQVLATTWGVAHPMRWWCRWRGAILHIVFHGSEVTRVTDPQKMRRVCSGAKHLWAVSSFLAQQLSTQGLTCETLPAPVLLPDALPPRPYGRWLFVGRATPLKGADRFLGLVAGEPEVSAVVVGDGPELAKLVNLADTLGISERVKFLGEVPRDEVQAQYHQAGVLFLLSRLDEDGHGGEGLGLTLIEGAVCQVATVSSAVGGLPEAVGAGLVLNDPDNIEGSLASLRSWWSAERGVTCREVAIGRHGIVKTIESLCRFTMSGS
jgi:glycosyltransferase involved in cell wall biosynthesis